MTDRKLRIAFVGNFRVPYSSENHHAATLRSMGHEVIEMQESVWPSDEIRGTVLSRHGKCDLLIWVHTHGWHTPSTGGFTVGQILAEIREVGVPTMTYHLDLWLGLERQKDLETDDFYREVEYFFTADRKMADWFNEHTRVKGRFMPAGVFDDEAYFLNRDKQNSIIFVGSRGYHPEWPYRAQLIDWLADTYGDQFKHYGGDGLGVVRGHELNELYARTKIVIGDTLCKDFDYPDYFSDRLFETTGRGGFLIFPKIKGLEKCFDIENNSLRERQLITYEFNDFNGLKKKIDFYLKNENLRETIRLNSYLRTKSQHTYWHRWNDILETIINNKE